MFQLVLCLKRILLSISRNAGLEITDGTLAIIISRNAPEKASNCRPVVAVKPIFGGLHLSSRIQLSTLTRFNKIAIQGKGPDGKWTRKPLAHRESNIFNLCVICPPEICGNLVFKHIHAASSYTICR